MHNKVGGGGGGGPLYAPPEKIKFAEPLKIAIFMKCFFQPLVVLFGAIILIFKY